MDVRTCFSVICKHFLKDFKPEYGMALMFFFQNLF